MQPTRQHSQLHAVAQQLVRISSVAAEIYHDQMDLVGHFTAQNMFRIDPILHRVELLNGLFSLEFYPPKSHTHLIETQFEFAGQQQEVIEDFFLHDVHFLTGDLKPQHSLFLRNQAQHLRQLILQQVYLWVDGAARVKQLLLHLDAMQAQILDQALMQADDQYQPVLTKFVQQGQPIPEDVLTALSTLCALEFVEGETFLPVQALMQSYDDFCFSAAEFLPKAMYRILSISFPERFNLQDLIDHQDDIRLLYRHAEEHGHLLGFARLMHREVWQRSDALAKPHFLKSCPLIWQKKVAKLPLFDYPRAVNWLFKQSAQVLDWLSLNMQHTSVRVAVTALSFVDCSQAHPRIILATLQYFQYSAARMFIQSCNVYATQQAWFAHAHNVSLIPHGEKQSLDDPRVAISPSILYLDEWMSLLKTVAQQDEHLVKHVFRRLSRVMQSYMTYLQQITQDLPLALLDYIQPESQQQRDFYTVLQRYQIQPDDFRQRFYLRAHNIRVSVFDGYVRDYLMEYFAVHMHIPKSLSWLGLFHQAVQWHQQVYKAELFAKLKKEIPCSTWRAKSPQQILYFSGWCFEELTDLDRIIEESKNFKHCLALSYAKAMSEGLYVAFHMASPHYVQQLTLGCYFRNGQLEFDQLEYPNNQKAEQLLVTIAEQFIAWLNSQLSSRS
ncbi:hypothetical protein KAM398_06230 [Acinetobacter sp. KAM398]|uniref:hypothetical protein n=1 Tax=unclassified Acinetobacter TaxID=196816 RepID=UPI001F1A9624|nr:MULTISPECIES: hypothetical protein [unclassified Acinetobacter]GJC30490.1 hypothetical protein KAM392_04690 [Acinetobacter sp. KAM392]GJC33406.1 hypothetical protein KAM393_05750 [Acinetobacter sp. KAM393]GJC36235.1 hypothetical protein KAM394_05750 [Acinetobacter sp. KAM394]GJC39054.1 hypothetical protein KAM395_05750 [Acinetobacter sp. KAM395]GJC42019.1 hypothetical protein KAM396_07160 [Acinetobacter sp. KAM396]